MKCTIHGKKIKITNELKKYMETKLAKLDKYFDEPDNYTATIVLRNIEPERILEVTVPIQKVILRAEESNKDAYAAVDLAIDKLERQIRKNKTRMNKKVDKDKITGFITDFKTDKSEDDKSKIVKRKMVELKPMSEEEAILQMNLIDHEFFIFRDAKTGEIEVVYKRRDKDYGLIKEKR